MIGFFSTGCRKFASTQSLHFSYDVDGNTQEIVSSHTRRMKVKWKQFRTVDDIVPSILAMCFLSLGR